MGRIRRLPRLHWPRPQGWFPSSWWHPSRTGYEPGLRMYSNSERVPLCQDTINSTSRWIALKDDLSRSDNPENTKTMKSVTNNDTSTDVGPSETRPTASISCNDSRIYLLSRRHRRRCYRQKESIAAHSISHYHTGRNEVGRICERSGGEGVKACGQRRRKLINV